MESGYSSFQTRTMNDQLQDVRRLENEFADAMNRMYAVGNGLARLRASLEVQTSAAPETWVSPHAQPVPAPGPTAPTPPVAAPRPVPATPVAPAAGSSAG